jgi:hypothetical protein
VRLVHITGTTGITDIDFGDATDAQWAFVIFDGSLLLTHSATLVLPGLANIQTGAGDRCIVAQDNGDTAYVLHYERADGLEMANPSNTSIANQSPPASATTLLTGSLVNIPGSGAKIGSRFIWHAILSKTAAGTVAPVFLVKIGTNGTTADGTVLTFTFPAVGTGAIDEMEVWIEMQIVSLGAAAVVRGQLWMTRRLMTGVTGWYSVAGALRIIGTPATFNSTVAALKAHLSLTLGASYVVTAETVSIETQNL